MASRDAGPSPMTPEWSGQLAIAVHSPIWQSLAGMERRDAFIAAATQYATYDDLPADVKAIYQEALRGFAFDDSLTS
jgi:hypothetical protein